MAPNAQPVARKPFWFAVALAGALTIVILIPKPTSVESNSKLENPQERAEELISGFLSRLSDDVPREELPRRKNFEGIDPVRDLFRVEIAPRDTPRSSPSTGEARPQKNVDPTPAKTPEVPTLGGLLLDGDRRIAILNGRAVTEGEQVMGYEVTSIETDAVVLQRDGHTRRITWQQ